MNGKSIMGVMMLAAECGSSVTVRANGPDAEQAAEALAELIADGFGETVSMTRAAPWHRRVAGRGVRARRWSCAATFPRCPTARCRPTRSRARCAGCARRSTPWSSHLQELGERVLERAGQEESRIFDAQILMAQDEDFLASVEMLIRNNLLSAETAYEFKALELRALWSAAPRRLRERLADLHAIQLRMLHRLLGGTDSELWSIPADEQVIVVAHELSPGLTVQLDREHVVGLVSEEGTRTSHAAILAHSLGIPGGDGRGRGAGRDPRRHHAAARRAERHHRARSRPRTSWRRPRSRSAGGTSSSSSSRRGGAAGRDARRAGRSR